MVGNPPALRTENTCWGKLPGAACREIHAKNPPALRAGGNPGQAKCPEQKVPAAAGGEKQKTKIDNLKETLHKSHQKSKDLELLLKTYLLN